MVVLDNSGRVLSPLSGGQRVEVQMLPWPDGVGERSEGRVGRLTKLHGIVVPHRDGVEAGGNGAAAGERGVVTHEVPEAVQGPGHPQKVPASTTARDLN